ncbi:HK97-gp10 family putative phage morphogenesis protein [Thermomonospora cellulosilytica]|uniref:HK97 gp10 family phage protein n=1 Tax=Thermomonospora cellulosilytica TaxID=1411118 RepID=A0A7W3R6X9_9ACTN|nr:HK97-gp10 family putative phage morphogenesis protein [Thermomonospora cellulosilytica]MBA9002011.1 HK97 gp10 family phage protein [Thermomonospora cellulosilytica]
MAQRVEIAGWDRLLRRLNDLPEDIHEGAVKAITDAANDVRDETRDTVRVDTGRARDGTVARINAARLRAEVGWFDPDLYYMKFQEFGTEEITANPALTLAAQRERRRFAQRLSADVRAALEGRL